MKAVCWNGKHKVDVMSVPDPSILNPRDAILKITTTAICGSDLHLYDGYIPTMEKGDILGHEFMGEVVELGTAVTNLKKGIVLSSLLRSLVAIVLIKAVERRCDARHTQTRSSTRDPGRQND